MPKRGKSKNSTSRHYIRHKPSKDYIDSDLNQHAYKMDNFQHLHNMDRHKYDDPRMKYIQIKKALGYLDNIKNVWDKGELRKNLLLFREVTQDGSFERVGRISDYGGIYNDFTHIQDYLSAALKNMDSESLELARRTKESLLEKINLRESELNNIKREYDPSLGMIVKTGAIIGFVGALSVLSFNMTGNVVSVISKSSNNAVGLSLLLLGAFAGFFWVVLREGKFKKKI